MVPSIHSSKNIKIKYQSNKKGWSNKFTVVHTYITYYTDVYHGLYIYIHILLKKLLILYILR